MPDNTMEIAATESKRISAYSLDVIENRSEKFDCVTATIDVPWQQFLSTFIERFRELYPADWQTLEQICNSPGIFYPASGRPSQGTCTTPAPSPEALLREQYCAYTDLAVPF
ncbi:hypothetical protein [Pseudomonas syringae]|uniref:hypothetical protein n=1 Tax=Pseudomonas syringae TaxID=317 RepID=UPI0012FDADE0|nr:hypothetical protein [Pseudomonas syringae]